MAHKIPKLQWANTSMTATAIATDQFQVASTATLGVGMYVVGTGIPAGTTITSIDSSTTFSVSNTFPYEELVTEGGDPFVTEGGDPFVTEDSITTLTLSFYFELVFDYPPKEETGEILDSNENISVSRSGLRQVSVNFIEASRKPKFSFLSQTIFDSLQTFFTTWAAFGKVFRYFDDKLSVSYIEYELQALKFEPKKIAARGPSAYVWEVPLTFRRVL